MTVDLRPAEDRRLQGETASAWAPVCPIGALQPDRGVAALIGRQQVAIFLLSSPQEVYAIDNHDPFSQANVLARGLVGSVGDRPVVASPIYKERFDLRDGTCLDGDRSVSTWPARIRDGWVEVGGVGDS